MADLIDEIYLPDFTKRKIREGDAYKLLTKNKMDTSTLEGYENHPDAGVVNFESFDKFLGEGGTKEDWIARHATPEVQKEFFGNVSDFMLETGKDTVLSLATAVVNGADVATNLMPLFVKALDKAPLATGMPEGFLNEANEKQVYDFANNISNNLGEAREYLNEFKKDDNFVSQLVGVMGQDLLYSIPIYNKLRAAGIPKYPAFFISGGVGGAIGIEDKIMGAESTFSQEFFSKDIIELKNLIGILPDTPEDKIADEVVQALEYGAFSAAIPGIIDAFKFMKQYVPAMAGTTGAAVGMTADNEAEGSPLKAIVNAVNKVPVFKSAVIDATEKKITKGSGLQIFNTIKNTPGVKESELKWIGLETFLKDKKNITQDEVLEFINANKLDVNERRFGAADMQQGQVKPLKDFTREETAKLENKIFEDIEADRVPESYSHVADHIGYLKAANFQRLDNFPIKKTENFDELPTEVTDQNYNMGSYMNDYELYRATEGLDDYGSGEIGFDYWKNTFGEFYEVFAIKSKGTRQLLDDKIEQDLYVKFARNETTIPEEMIRNADVNNGFHIQADEFENFKKYLDDNGAYISRYHKMEIPKDQQEAVFNELMIRSNEEEFYQRTSGDSITEALDEYIGAGAARPKYEQYTEPGGEAYSELVFTLSKGGENVGTKFPLETNVTKQATIRDAQIRTSPHFDVSGEIAHVRFKTREQGNMKILSVEEMQSDLVQGTKQFNEDAINQQRANLLSKESTRQSDAKVFENVSDEDVQKMLKDNPPENLIKDFPFRNNWYELTLKRLIRYAADNGFDAVAIPKGSLAANRYGQKIKPFDSLSFSKSKNAVDIEFGYTDPLTKSRSVQKIEYYVLDTDGSINANDFKRLNEDVGPKLADEILNKLRTQEVIKPITFDKTQIGGSGKGKFELYDKTIPSYMKKYAKKWNAKVYDDKIGRKVYDDEIDDMVDLDPIDDIPVTVLELSDEMKTGVQSSSQPLFELLGGVSLATWGAQAVSDSMENNTISQTTN